MSWAFPTWPSNGEINFPGAFLFKKFFCAAPGAMLLVDEMLYLYTRDDV